MKIKIDKSIIMESILSNIRDAYNRGETEEVAPTSDSNPISNTTDNSTSKSDRSAMADMSQQGTRNIFMGQNASNNYNGTKPIREANASLETNLDQR